MGEAGAITTASEELAERCRVLRDHGQRERYIHVTAEGGNARLDALQAVVLSVKLGWPDRWNDARPRVAARYRDPLARAPPGLPAQPSAAPPPDHPPRP